MPVRDISNARRGRSLNPLDRFFAKVEAGVCMEWVGSANVDGYGRFRDCRRTWMAHRWIWTYVYGPVPDGMTVDHLCRNPKCVDPTHLRLLAIRDNILAGQNGAARNRRKTHCKRGHEFTPENTRSLPRDRRECRTCTRAAGAARRQLARVAS